MIGIDRNGSRLWKGANSARHEGLSNALFLRAPVEHLEEHFPPGRVSEIWLPFPDPLPKNRQARHRLVSPLFLQRYRRLLLPGGVVYLKTDNSDLVDFAQQSVLAAGGRILETIDRRLEDYEELEAVQTTYEKRYRAEGRAIYVRQFCLDRLPESNK